MTTHAPSTELDSTVPSNATRTWTVRDAVRESRTSTRVIAVAIAVAAGLLALDRAIPFAASAVVIALLPAVLVDLIDRRLPNRLVAGAAAIGVTVMLIDVVLGGDVRIVDASLGAAAMAGPLLAAHLIAPASMGFGDVKFALVLGAALGLMAPSAALVALAAGSCLAMVHGLLTRQRVIAFGPALLLGALVVLLASATDIVVFTDTATAALSTGRTR